MKFLLKIVVFAIYVFISLSVDCDGDYSCQSDYTCCKTSSNEWACCPYRNAICCSKFDTCCKSGSVCSSKGCLNSLKTSNWSDIFEEPAPLVGIKE